MAVSVIPLDCDISCTSISKNGTEQIPVWTDDKIKNLWSSLLSLELVSKCCEDEELQGILLLLETTFSVFKNLKKKCNEAESAYQIVKRDLESTKEDMCRVEEDLKCHKKVVCERCPELEKEIGAQKKKLEYNENRIKSIVSILSINNTSEDSDRNLPSGQKTAVDKAYDLVSQMLLENDNINLEKNKHIGVKSGIKRLRHDTTESPQMTPGKKRKKRNKVTAKADILNTKNRERDTETLYYGDTLAPESVSVNEGIMCSDVVKEIVPETLCSQYPAKFSDMEKSMPQLSSININEKMDNIQTTPKKQISQEKVTRRSSPILGSCNRKSTHKTSHSNNYNMTVVDSPCNNPVTSKSLIPNGKTDNCVTGSSLHSYKEDADRSPSLLKIEAGMSDSIAVGAYKVEDNSQERKNEKHEQNVLCALEDNQESMKNIQADFWKLKPVPNVNVNMKNSVDVGSHKLKQTTLSVASFSKKQDLCRLKEFNGGVRQSSSLADQISGICDEETSLKLAIKESLNGKDNTESVSSENKSPGMRNLRIGSAEDDDDFVVASPNASRFWTSPRRKCVYARDRPSVSRKGDITLISVSPRKKQIQSSAGRKDMDETLFVPLYTSTLQDGAYGSREIKRVLETEELSSEQNFKGTYHPSEMKNRIESELMKKHDCSFDRIPEKISTSPNYKYRRDALRNREARRRLDGWDCEQCKTYYAVANSSNPTELKRHLKQCSKHRDKYSVQSSTPPGYWDVNFPNTEESKLEVTLAPKNVPIAKD